MLEDKDRIFQNLYNDFGADLKSAKQRGDWKDTKEICGKGREWIINEIKASELRGRGGAGFPTGKKWRIVKQQKGPRLMAVNADEGEPQQPTIVTPDVCPVCGTEASDGASSCETCSFQFS